MDKLRALQYFVMAARERSFSRAARELEVTVPAVVKLVNALERELGATLFERSAQGLKLTTQGERYSEACRPLLEQLNAADQSVGRQHNQQHGTVVVGAHAELVMPTWLSRFHQSYPDIHLDVRAVSRVTMRDVAADVYLVHGWPRDTDMVHRVLAQPRLLTCAAPAYWAKHGVPTHPADLAGHVCLLYSNDEGTVNDLWEFVRGAEKVSVTTSGWMVSNTRQLSIDTALSGEGVVRVSDLMVPEHLLSGKLVPVLLDWQMSDAPPFNLLYASSQRTNGRVRAFIEFITDAFRDMQLKSPYASPQTNMPVRPYWSQRGLRRASAAKRR